MEIHIRKHGANAARECFMRDVVRRIGGRNSHPGLHRVHANIGRLARSKKNIQRNAFVLLVRSQSKSGLIARRRAVSISDLEGNGFEALANARWRTSAWRLSAATAAIACDAGGFGTANARPRVRQDGVRDVPCHRAGLHLVAQSAGSLLCCDRQSAGPDGGDLVAVA